MEPDRCYALWEAVLIGAGFWAITAAIAAAVGFGAAALAVVHEARDAEKRLEQSLRAFDGAAAQAAAATESTTPRA
ncbi:MAG TPA: hypothetical protein VD838_21245 [Anaeromyxobacteraceae bacterium]|nr:hypothetical protein [Anaeromyxobacteraceae bacterium]